jgi:lipopolysaccharide export system protein LptA
VASFQGKVVLDVDDMRITGPKADFLYDSTGDILKSVLFSGGARVSDPNKWATSDQVKVDFQQDQYIFSGDPRVVQNSDELRGEKIIFHNGGKRIEVIRAKAKIDKGRLEGNN